MLSKVCASWLVVLVLVLLPFAGPFSTFDLLAGSRVASLTMPSTPPAAVLSRVVMSRSVPFPARTARLRPTLMRLRAWAVAAAPRVAAASGSGGMGVDAGHPPGSPTVLRI
ncbi:MAG: hypothetical protein ABI868_18180 [Acidobacteriota bacterium]